jgi:fructokinase
VLLSVDPNVRAQFIPFDHARERIEPFLREADIVKLSQEDAEFIYPGIDDPDFFLEHILGLGPRLAAITRGSRGAILATSNARAWVPATARHVADTIGAGDSFMAALIDALMNSSAELSTLTADGLRAIGAHATEAAAITVSRPGADLPWRTELPAFD